eukprot:4963-Eustigmatos_ZCMA.PRE.1
MTCIVVVGCLATSDTLDGHTAALGLTEHFACPVLPCGKGLQSSLGCMKMWETIGDTTVHASA